MTAHAETRHNNRSLDESKWADHANAWRPPYINAAALKPRATETLLRISPVLGQSSHRDLIALLVEM